MLSKIATKDLVNRDVRFGGVERMIHMADRNKLLHTSSGNFLSGCTTQCNLHWITIARYLAQKEGVKRSIT